MNTKNQKEKADQYSKDAQFYVNMLSEIAEQEDDAVECEKCFHSFRLSWFDGRCPYCEVDHS